MGNHLIHGWTDERIELLKKLWGDGLSCSQIAKQLGWVTRNAVIGKVHRLGVSGRAPASKPSRAARPAPRPVGRSPSAPRALAQSPLRLAGNGTVFAGPREPRLPTEIIPFRLEAPGTATALTLGAHMCKWPIGDPREDNFTHCGRRVDVGPYCPGHARIAYQPVAVRKRSGAAELARSLRRYI